MCGSFHLEGAHVARDLQGEAFLPVHGCRLRQQWRCVCGWSESLQRDMPGDGGYANNNQRT